MSEKRRDHKGRILRDGESQRADLKYRFAYTDISGKRKEVTSWRLDDADPTPANKRKGSSLREMERQIEKDRYNHILSNGGECTVLSLAEKYIPMTVEVADCFRRIINRRKRVRTEPVIGGRVGFLFLDKNSKPTVAQHREKYNNDIGRLPLPVITPHICRHTFCTNMAKNGMNPKMLQYIMGHADISVTLNTYTHVQYEDAEKEMKRLYGIV
ncbi:MAG: integrase DNA-binding domain-containing protein [Ruminococcus sp.]|nr:integrase DNA-binding domain-containing protein [Ruminococcus sp.]MBR6393365.1 integrase DNA-binding domain-containing protein [Ruminococcus sp.]